MGLTQKSKILPQLIGQLKTAGDLLYGVKYAFPV